MINTSRSFPNAHFPHGALFLVAALPQRAYAPLTCHDPKHRLLELKLLPIFLCSDTTTKGVKALKNLVKDDEKSANAIEKLLNDEHKRFSNKVRTFLSPNCQLWGLSGATRPCLGSMECNIIVV